MHRVRLITRHLGPAGSFSAPVVETKLPGKLGNPDEQLWTDPRLDPDIREGMIADGRTAVADLPEGAVFNTNAQRAAFVNQVEKGMLERQSAQGGARGAGPPVEVQSLVETREWTIKGVDNNDVVLVMKRPKGSSAKLLPCFYHTHGGGMCMLSMKDPPFQSLYTTLASEGICVVGVEFRNSGGGLVYGPDAPLAPFPAGLNDCMSGLLHLFENKRELGISTIVVSGESGGGNLCAALAIKAKKEDLGPVIDGVYSMCPFISNSYDPAPPTLQSLTENEGYLGFSNAAIQLMADLYTRDGSADASNPMAWPLLATADDLRGLPPHVISVNELDALRDEGIAYYRKLRAAGVRARARVVIGTNHAADCPGKHYSLVPDAAEATTQDILAFIRSL